MSFDGVGYIVHHSGTSIVYASVLGHLVHPLHLVVALPLAFQHVAGREGVFLSSRNCSLVEWLNSANK